LPQPEDIDKARMLLAMVTVVAAFAFIFLGLSSRAYSTQKSVEKRRLLALIREAV
jgi:cell division protein FtsL